MVNQDKPWILMNCPNFNAAPRIWVSLDTRRLIFPSVMMSEPEALSWELVVRLRSSEAAP